MNEKEELSPEAIEERKFWYSKPFVIFAMLDWARGRETCFLVKNSYGSNVRYLNAGSVEMFMKYLGIQTNTEKQIGEIAKNPFKFLSSKNYSIYCSLAKINWERCPIKAFSYSVKERQSQQETIREDLIDYMEDFTCGIDFDGDQAFMMENGKEKKVKLDKINQKSAVNRALNDMKKIIQVFNEYKIQWFCQFSGSRGFHFFFNVPLEISIKQKVEVANKVLKTLAETFDLQTLDKGSYNHRKVFKTPYSLVATNNINRVVLPLSDSDLENFYLENMEVYPVYHNVRDLKTRGLLWRNQNVNKKESIRLFKKFLKDYEIEISKQEKNERRKRKIN